MGPQIIFLADCVLGGDIDEIIWWVASAGVLAVAAMACCQIMNLNSKWRLGTEMGIILKEECNFTFKTSWPLHERRLFRRTTKVQDLFPSNLFMEGIDYLIQNIGQWTQLITIHFVFLPLKNRRTPGKYTRFHRFWTLREWLEFISQPVHSSSYSACIELFHMGKMKYMRTKKLLLVAR